MPADEDLFHAWQEGDRHALEVLVSRHYASLVGHLARLIGNATLAEDLAQETFLRLVRDARTYRFPQPFLPWFYTIARNLAYTETHSAYQRHVLTGKPPPDIGSAELDPSQWIERWELHAALVSLSFEQREILSLRFGLDLSIELTAATLGIPPGTVKSRTFTALRRLRLVLMAPATTASEHGEAVHE